MAKGPKVPSATTAPHHLPPRQGTGRGSLAAGMHPPAGYFHDSHHMMALNHMAQIASANHAARIAQIHAHPIERIVTIRRLR